MQDPFLFADSVAGFIQYVFVIGLLVMSIVTAKQISGKASKGLTSWATKTAGAAAFGLTAWAGRQTLGRGGAMIADSRYARELAASDNLADRIKGRSLIGLGNFAKSSSFDFRGTSFGSSGLGDVGKAQRGGYEAWYKARQKAQEARNKGYGAETEATATEVEQAKLNELRAKEAYRLATTEDEKKARLEEVKTTTRERLILEQKAKIEKAESQQSGAWFDQGTFASTEGSGRLRRLGTMWTALANPENRAAAEALERASGTDKRKAEEELARQEYLRDNAVVEQLVAAVKKTTEEHAEAAKDAQKELLDINKNMERLIEEAKQRNIWDETNQRVRQAGFGELRGRDAEIRTGIESLRLAKKEQEANRDAAISAVDTTNGRTLEELEKQLENAKKKRDANKKGAAAKEKKERYEQYKAVNEEMKKEEETSDKKEAKEAPAPAEPKEESPETA